MLRYEGEDWKVHEFIYEELIDYGLLCVDSEKTLTCSIGLSDLSWLNGLSLTNVVLLRGIFWLALFMHQLTQTWLFYVCRCLFCMTTSIWHIWRWLRSCLNTAVVWISCFQQLSQDIFNSCLKIFSTAASRYFQQLSKDVFNSCLKMFKTAA